MYLIKYYIFTVTYKEAELKLERLKTEETALTSNSDRDSKTHSDKIEQTLKRRKLFKHLESQNQELLNLESAKENSESAETGLDNFQATEGLQQMMDVINPGDDLVIDQHSALPFLKESTIANINANEDTVSKNQEMITEPQSEINSSTILKIRSFGNTTPLSFNDGQYLPGIINYIRLIYMFYVKVFLATE